MKPAPFAYADPRTVPEALALLSDYGDDGKLLAGGQSLMPLLNMRLAQPRAVIDLNRIAELQYIKATAREGLSGYAFGAMTRQRALERANDGIPLLREAIEFVGHAAIRNRGTIGGSVAHGDPAAELPLVFLALDGVATMRSSRGDRVIPASEFFAYTFTTALEPDELLTEIWLPIPASRTGQTFLEVARRHGDFALVAVAASLTLDQQGRCAAVRLAVGGAAPIPVRATAAEELLTDELPEEVRLRAAAALVDEALDPAGDIHADAIYRREVARTLALRALRLARDRVPAVAA